MLTRLTPQRSRRHAPWAIVLFVPIVLAAHVNAGVFDPFGPNTPFIVQQEATPITPADVPNADAPIEPFAAFPYRDVDPTFASYGLAVGDRGVDVPLFAMDGRPVSLHDSMNASRPTLWISVSLTCPIARAHIEDAERVAREYADRIDVRLIYVVEAHPVVDPSPYTGAEWPSAENTEQGILYRQPRTMGERIALATELQRRHGVSLPILVDGPSNAWWETYGPAPNQAVLLAPDGTVLIEHGWFDGDGLDIDTDLARLSVL